MPAKKGEVLIGKVGVDSGSLCITDPCYIDSEWEKEEFDFKEKAVFPNGKEEIIRRCTKRWWEIIEDINSGKIKLEPVNEKAKHNFSYNAIAKITLAPPHHGQLNYKMGHPGVAVAFSSGIGDGLYPVYAKIVDLGDWGLRIAEIRVDMMDHCLLTKEEKKDISRRKNKRKK